MWRSVLACILENPSVRGRRRPIGPHPAPVRSATSRLRLQLASVPLAALVLAVWTPSPTAAQDWGSDPEADWSTPSRSDPVATLSGWSARAGLGFTAAPESLLLQFEVPYAFDQWVSAGPLLQVGFDGENTVVGSSMNVTITIPDLPGSDFDRLHPYGFVGLGFAVVEDDDRKDDNISAGLLIPVGFGIEYQISDRLALGSQMTFNILPEEILEQRFWYSWQVGAVRIAF